MKWIKYLKYLKYLNKIDDFKKVIKEGKDIVDKIVPIIDQIKDPALRKEIREFKEAVDALLKKEE